MFILVILVKSIFISIQPCSLPRGTCCAWSSVGMMTRLPSALQLAGLAWPSSLRHITFEFVVSSTANPSVCVYLRSWCVTDHVKCKTKWFPNDGKISSVLPDVTMTWDADRPWSDCVSITNQPKKIFRSSWEHYLLLFNIEIDTPIHHLPQYENWNTNQTVDETVAESSPHIYKHIYFWSYAQNYNQTL